MRRNLSTRKPGELLRVLPGGPAGTLIGSGALAGSYGETLTFTRATTASYTNASGLVASMASGNPRVEASGLLIERAATNVITNSEALSGFSLASSGPPADPTITSNTTDVTAPDGTTNAEKIAFPAVSAGQFSFMLKSFTGTAAAWSGGLWLRTLSGTATVYLFFLTGVNTYHTVTCNVTSTWTRFLIENKTLTAATWYLCLGVDTRDGNQSAQSAQTIYGFGAQAEAGQFISSYIPTGGASATRNVETLTLSNPLSSGDTRWSLEATIDGRTWPSAAGNAIVQLGDAYAANNTATLTLEDASGKVVFVVFDNAGATKSFLSTSALSTGAHRLRVVNDAGTLSLYDNGAPIAGATSGAGTGTITTMPGTIRVGALSSSGNANLNANIHSISVRKL